MRTKHKVLGVVAALCISQLAMAAWMPLNDGNSIEYGGMIFSDLQISSSVFDGGIAPAPEQINITGIMDAYGNYGLKFYADPSWQAGDGEVVLSSISYKVALQDSSRSFTGYGLGIGSIVEQGSVTAQASVFDGEGNALSSLALARTQGLGSQVTAASFSEATELLVVKDFSLTGIGGDVSMCVFDDTYSVIPEPASMGMVGAGSIFSLLLRQKSRRRNRKGSGGFDAVVLDEDTSIDLFDEATLGYVYTGRQRLKKPVF